MEATTPISSASQFIPADDDDFDEDAMPAMSYPGMAASPLPQNSNANANANANVNSVHGLNPARIPVTPISARSPVPLSANTKGKGRAPASPLPGAGGSSGAGAGGDGAGALSGNIGSAAPGTNRGNAAAGNRRMIGGIRVETRYTGVDTLDEPVMTTMGRDLLSIYSKLVQVLYPRRSGEAREVLRDWDLWGPLLLCLALGVMLSINAPPDQSLPMFSTVIALISVGSVVVTLQTQLLGGRVSFFQALCVLGYCVAPLDIAALIATFVPTIYVRVPICLLCWAWCVWAAVNFFDGTKIEPNRILLAVYPLLLFYFILAWMILIQ